MEKILILKFTKKTWNKPVIHGLSQVSDLVFNILEAKVLPRQDAFVIMSLEGTEEDFSKGMDYLKSANVIIEEVTENIKKDEDRCVHCGACCRLPNDCRFIKTNGDGKIYCAAYPIRPLNCRKYPRTESELITADTCGYGFD